MFQFPGFPSHRLCIYLWITAHYCSWVPSFGHLRVNGYLLLTAAFRSLSRPSSAPSAKASALCSFLLNQLITRLFLFMLRCCLLFRQLHTLVCAFLFRSRALPKAENSSWWLPTLALKCRASLLFFTHVKILLVFLFNNRLSKLCITLPVFRKTNILNFVVFVFFDTLFSFQGAW